MINVTFVERPGGKVWWVLDDLERVPLWYGVIVEAPSGEFLFNTIYAWRGNWCTAVRKFSTRTEAAMALVASYWKDRDRMEK